jgi:RNA polymerase sigma-70 factor (ECF subfamily)
LRQHRGGASSWRAVASEVPDIVQEVFIRAFDPRTRRRFDGIRDYAPFLIHIARNAAVDHLRRLRHQVPADVEQVLAAEPSARDVTEEFAERETMDVVANYIANLTPELKRVHDLLYVHGLAEREAAVALGVGRQVIRTLAARLRDGLRSALAARDQRGGTTSLRKEQRRSTQTG